mmetsp:Transcript_33751/g.81741  ORF Transcript_33751/g.81741 Transcript_33751/m.81741 type:complete len:333 (-) Transcript_33751:46-1044(-)
MGDDGWRECLHRGDVLRVRHHLLQNPSLLNAPFDVDKTYPIHVVCKRKHLGALDLLLQKGARLDVVTFARQSALHLAAEVDFAEGCLMLAEWGAHMDAQDSSGQTPLHRAAYMGAARAVDVLLATNAKPTILDEGRATALHKAAYTGRPDVVALLLSTPQGAQLLAAPSGDSQWTPLHFAAFGGFSEVCVQLIGARAPVDVRDEESCTPLHRAAFSGDPHTAACLLKAQADVNAEDRCRQTPLHIASEEGHAEVAQVLISRGASVATGRRGRTALHAAAEGTSAGHLRVCNTLLQHGGDPVTTFRGTASPMYVAKRNRNHDLVALFEQGAQQ